MSFTDRLKEMFEEIFGGGVFDSVENVLKLNPSTGAWSTVWVAVSSVYESVMIPIAVGLMLIWFLTSLMDKAASEQASFEQMFMLFAKLVGAWYLINNGFEIFTKLWGLGISVIGEVGDAFADGTVEGIDYKTLWKDMTGVEWSGGKVKFLPGILLFGQLLIPWVASKAMIVVTQFICYSRIIEMLLRMLAAPIALSDFMTEGLHGAGWRYLKTFLAICLQGMIIVAIAEIYPLTMNAVLSDCVGFWETTMRYLAFSFAAIALMFKSLTITKELVGTS